MIPDDVLELLTRLVTDGNGDRKPLERLVREAEQWSNSADLNEAYLTDLALDAGRLLAKYEGADMLLPAENIALTVAAAQVRRGEEPSPNVATVCVLALCRLTGRPLPHDYLETLGVISG